MSVETPEQTQSERVERVGSFFDHPENYLDRRGYDIRIRYETVQTFMDGKQYEKILDIGCGDGSLSVPLLDSRRHLTLLDISSNMLALARSRVPKDLADRVDLVKEDFLQAPFQKESFDLVICVGVLAHVPSPSAMIDKIASVLKPGGTLILECTDAFHFVGRISYYWNRLAWILNPPKFRQSVHSAATISRMVRERGFEMSSLFRYALPLPKTGQLFTQENLYKGIRAIFGDAKQNRNTWLGNEYIFRLSRR